MKYKDFFIHEEATIMDALQQVNRVNGATLFVVNKEEQLYGTVTDGDIRRGLINGKQLHERVTTIMNVSPKCLTKPTVHWEQQLKKYNVQALPLLNEQGVIIDIYSRKTKAVLQLPNWVVLMAGGLGSRLRPLTDRMPKPLLPVGGKPILEIIIEHLARLGFYQFFISVNYKKEMIMDYFGTGEKWGVQITYLVEEQQLGTGGPLSLLPSQPKHPLIMMNGDLLTNLDFQQLLAHHTECGNEATMGVLQYEFTVPYGVIEANKQQQLLRLVEKPTYYYYVNAGIYVLNPEVVSLVPKNIFYNITTLFDALIAKNNKAGIYEIQDYWLDIGQPRDYERANLDVKDGLL